MAAPAQDNTQTSAPSQGKGPSQNNQNYDQGRQYQPVGANNGPMGQNPVQRNSGNYGPQVQQPLGSFPPPQITNYGPGSFPQPQVMPPQPFDFSAIAQANPNINPAEITDLQGLSGPAYDQQLAKLQAMGVTNLPPTNPFAQPQVQQPLVQQPLVQQPQVMPRFKQPNFGNTGGPLIKPPQPQVMPSQLQVLPGRPMPMPTNMAQQPQGLAQLQQMLRGKR